MSQCKSIWRCHAPFWSPWTPSELQFEQFSSDFGYSLCSLCHFRLILSSFAVHFVGVLGDLISQQFDSTDSLKSFGSRRLPMKRDHLWPSFRSPGPFDRSLTSLTCLLTWAVLTFSWALLDVLLGLSEPFGALLGSS